MRSFVGVALALLGIGVTVAGCDGVLGIQVLDDPASTDASSADADTDSSDAWTGIGDAQSADAADSTDALAACGPLSCAGGCCDPTGRCIPASMQGVATCGTGGLACGACQAGESCSGGACSCGGTACTGCCDAHGNCLTQETNTACGAAGTACVQCASGQECGGQRQCVCDATSCPDGCCTTAGTCEHYSAQSMTSCGTGGALCSACVTGTTCNNAGECVCNAQSCPSGCCTAAGTCEDYASQSPTSCGTGGTSCAACAGSGSCISGQCTCGGTSCAGCCSGSTCELYANENSNSCGAGGAACSTCPTGTECNSQGACACNAQSCPNGCCNASGQCVPYASQTFTSCGAGGASCGACGTGLDCSTATGTCVCDAARCPSGCCSGGPTGTCEAYSTQTAASCGTAGATCSPCGNGVCDTTTGTCTCDAQTCPNGCCNGGPSGPCLPYASQGTGTCGTGGASCQSCSGGLQCSSAGACGPVLTVNFRPIGAGVTGSIISNPPGISCTGPCTTSAVFPSGTVVQLTVTGVSGSALVGWLPTSCSGTTCSVTMTSSQTVTYTATGNNIIFTTSAGFPGNLGGLAGANAKCSTAAANAGLPGHYVAWLATTTTDAQSGLGSARGWVRPDGLPFADTVGTSGGTTGLINGQVYYPPLLTELGIPIESSFVYTGAAADGSWSGESCSDWASASSTVSGSVGASYGSGLSWSIGGGGIACSSAGQMYCMGTDLAAPVSFSAQTGRRAFVSKGNFDPSTGIATADQLCQSEATSAGLPNASQFLAFIPSTTASAFSRFSTSGANWVRPDGTQLTSSPSSFVPMAGIDQHADGSYTSSAFYVWSGDGAGTAPGTSAKTCSGWTSSAGSGEVITVALSGTYWFSWNGSGITMACNTSAPVYCLEN